ncbi:MAG: U32 family peptidase [Bacteroidales bacterium]|nr:U32 family peptidase [Bacteroidales bacterium]
MNPVELLSPAKDRECGIQAIRHGADAVYIGAPRFSARAAAGNSWESIEKLLRYAHLYKAKVLVALNTLLYDNELEEARQMAVRCYEMGVDALIIQDMGLLRMDLPPIALHASTQTDNRDAAKVRFLSEVGFRRVVLARELSLAQIAAIHRQTDVELEVFVHGSLCVSYSGQCYMSQASCGRSANRGRCAQYCRLPYDLLDADRHTLMAGKHLLSLKDMDRSDDLAALLDAGVTSLKIEGRLKDADYVKNVTLYYRRRLDAVLEGRPDRVKASLGKVYADFIPNPKRTFHRGGTDYFLQGKRTPMANFDTPKSMGEEVAEVVEARPRSLKVRMRQNIHNGDGLCCLDAEGRLQGFRVNRVENGTLFLSETVSGIGVGTVLFRNEDRLFARQLQGETARRLIGLRMRLAETSQGFSLSLTDEEGCSVRVERPAEKQVAEKAAMAEQQIRSQLGKWGGTPFDPLGITLDFSQNWFIPSALLAGMRREAAALLEQRRSDSRPADVLRTEKPVRYPSLSPEGGLDYTANVLNGKALQFYLEHGAERVEPAMEAGNADIPGDSKALMRCRYCLRDALSACPKRHPEKAAAYQEPLYLRHGAFTYRLRFDCDRCEMIVEKE